MVARPPNSGVSSISDSLTFRTSCTESTTTPIITRVVALAVDELLGKQEVVIKSLGEMFKNIRGIAGGAILGDGRIGLILDTGGLLSLVGKMTSQVAA